MLDAVTFAGGWMLDRVMAGWDVTVLIGGDEDVRPLEILGAEVRDLESVLESWEDRPHPQTVAVAADLFDSDSRVRQHVLNALEQGATEVTLWGEHLPAELDESVEFGAAPTSARPHGRSRLRRSRRRTIRRPRPSATPRRSAAE